MKDWAGALRDMERVWGSLCISQSVVLGVCSLDSVSMLIFTQKCIEDHLQCQVSD